MNKFLEVLKTICREWEVTINLTDIVSVEYTPKSEDYYESLKLHCRSDAEMYEFTIEITDLHYFYSVIVEGVKDSPYPCDNIEIHIDRLYDVSAIIPQKGCH